MIEDEEVRLWREVSGSAPTLCEHYGQVIEPGKEREIAPSDRRTLRAADVVISCTEC